MSISGAKSKKTAREGGAATKKRADRKAAPRKPKAKNAVNRIDVFVLEYLIDLNGAKAAIRAGYSPAAARQQAAELLARPDVQAKVKEAMDARATRTGITADVVLQRFFAVATADPRELIELHRVCCRYCWGKGNRYQYTPREMEDARRRHAEDEAEARSNGATTFRKFSEDGGTGYDPRKDPNPDCPECFGQGEERVQPKDTRDLSPAAQLLYAGVKTTQHGLEIKMHDQLGALVNVGKHLGMFEKKVSLSGEIGVHKTLSDVLDDIDGAGTGLPAHASRGS